MPKLFQAVFIVIVSCVACKKNASQEAANPSASIYFPPTTSNTWEAVSPTSLGWNEAKLPSLYNYLEGANTKAFIILKNGKIVVEKYFGTFTVDSNWYWASAGKTLTSYLVGIAQEKGLLNINEKTSTYLGAGWTSAPRNKEDLITVKHQLTMTTGLDDGTGDTDCTLPACLQYKANAGSRWAYHNAAYTLLDKVVENVSGQSYNSFFQTNLKEKIGMNGIWLKSPNANNVFYSTARSMARFGLLMLNQGMWDKTKILGDNAYLNAQVNSSQGLNLSYGYLTWLNGKTSSMVPGFQTVFPRAVIPNAPSDLYAALGKNDQKIYVVPSQNLVVVRMGNASGTSEFAVSGFDNELWSLLNGIL